MDYYQELVCLTNLGDHAMEIIMWKMNYEFTKIYAIDVHLGLDALYLQAAILCIQHLVDKPTKQPRIGKIMQYK
jgi:hypothetical protein